jgi:hypothetical protein
MGIGQLYARVDIPSQGLRIWPLLKKGVGAVGPTLAPLTATLFPS